jgi:hypothetical protein
MITPRVILSVLIALAGLALFAYGMAAHNTVVLVTKEIVLPAPPPPPPSVWGGRSGPGGLSSPFFSPPPPPPPPAPQKVLVSFIQPERWLVRDVTVGGLARRDDGRIERTYSGKGPALCPT